jgi:hypothetical protein
MEDRWVHCVVTSCWWRADLFLFFRYTNLTIKWRWRSFLVIVVVLSAALFYIIRQLADAVAKTIQYDAWTNLFTENRHGMHDNDVLKIRSSLINPKRFFQLISQQMEQLSLVSSFVFDLFRIYNLESPTAKCRPLLESICGKGEWYARSTCFGWVKNWVTSLSLGRGFL